MGFELEFRDKHGRRISRHQWLRGIEEEAIDLAGEALEQKIRGVRCPVHASSVNNLRSRKTTRGVEYEWTACCERLSDAVGQVLGRA